MSGRYLLLILKIKLKKLKKQIHILAKHFILNNNEISLSNIFLGQDYTENEIRDYFHLVEEQLGKGVLRSFTETELLESEDNK